LIDEKNHQIELIVPDDQLSLAIGRRGQNVKLASKLVGWAIEVHSESYIAEQKKRLAEVLSQIEGLDPSTMEYLFKLGYHSPDNILNADEEDIAAVPGLNLALAQAIQQKAYELKVKMREEEEAAQEVKSGEAQ
jgi:N utilization substance protein A